MRITSCISNQLMVKVLSQISGWSKLLFIIRLLCFNLISSASKQNTPAMLCTRRGKNSYGQFQISKWDKFRRVFLCFACFCWTNSYGNFSYGQFHMHPKNLPRTYSEWLFHMDKFIRNIFVSKFVLTRNLAVYICPGHQRPSELILSMKSGRINMSLSCCDKFVLIRKFSCFKLGRFQLL